MAAGQSTEARRLGAFVTGERIAAGGMAAVYAATTADAGHPLAGRALALKILHDHLADDTDFVRMFRDEGRIAMQLDHPNVVRVHEVGEDGGTHFLVMDRVDGRNLARVLESLGGARKQVARAAAIAILKANLEALAYVHELQGRDGRPLGLVHRDISPHNILIADDERVLLTDFGIARGEHRSDRTRTGTIKGKLHYMSPEQARGSRVDARSDLYSLGVVAYELLTNRVLLGSEATLALQQRVATGRIELDDKALSRLPEDLRAWLVRSLASERDARFRDARAMLEALLATRAAASARFKPGTLTRLLDDAKAQSALPKPQLLFPEQDLSRPRTSEPDVPLPEGMVLTPQRPISGVFARASEVRRAVERRKVVELRPAGSPSRIGRNPIHDAEAKDRRSRRKSRRDRSAELDHDAAAVERSRVIALQAAGLAPDDPDLRPANDEATVDAKTLATVTRLRVEKERRVAVAGIVAWSCVAVLLFATLLEAWNARLDLPEVDERSFVALRDQIVSGAVSRFGGEPSASPATDAVASRGRAPVGGADVVVAPGAAAVALRPRVPAPAPIRNDRFLPRDALIPAP